MALNGDNLTSLKDWAEKRKIELTGELPKFQRVPGVIDELDEEIEEENLDAESLGSGTAELINLLLAVRESLIDCAVYQTKKRLMQLLIALKNCK